MARPRNPNVLEVPQLCPTHGMVPHRIHKIGRRPDGTQKTRARCPACHSAAELERYRSNKRS